MTIHVVGAGLAGLAAAVEAAGAGRAVQVYEATGQAGGRCRSIDDPVIGRRIDNGNHLVLNGNRATIEYLRTIDADNALVGPERAVFPFLDLPSGARWQVSIN
ncbi:MAG: FAD-dependent oxidoreductase, partial [Alphaproteobacteria bacterium]